MSDFLAKVRRSLARDSDLPLSAQAAKGVRYLLGSVLAPRYLRGVTALGARARTIGRPRIVNAGRIMIGADLAMNSQFSPVELVSQASATLTLGDRVHMNYGTSIRAASQITIADGVSLGPYCIIDDTDLSSDATMARPITIGAGAWLAGRVTVLPGVTVGPGAVITAGSIVADDIPAGVVAGGIPARVIRRIDDVAVQESLPATVQRVVAARIAPVAASTMPAVTLPALRGVVLADFTTGDLAIRLADPTVGPVMEVVDAPYCQTTQGLLTGAPGDASDFALVWTRPEFALPSFDRIVRGLGASARELEDDVDAFVALLQRGATTFRHVFVPLWTLPAHQRGLGLIDGRPGGLTWALSTVNHRLMSQLAATANVYVLPTQRWLEATAERGQSMAKGWYLGKVPYAAPLFAETALELKAAMRAIAGQARKLLVLDLDDTLWGGIVGDIGWENLQLGGHDGAGEAFVDFQQALQALTRRGVVLALVSKNTESVALQAIDEHPQMVLRRTDFVGWRINWNDKAQNIADLTAELNLGLQSVVFIDDNPVERARVRDALPEVFVPEWPMDPLHYVEQLHALRCFDSPAISSEDAERTALYAAERERGATLARVGSIDDWLATLGLEIVAEPLNAANVVRTAQLLNKTNQMNLATRRLSEGELMAWAADDRRAVWALTVTDKFGSAGLTGIVSVEARDDSCRVVDLVLSCRVMGRRIEHVMLWLAGEWARARGIARVDLQLVPTAKNRPCHELLLASALGRDTAGLNFHWDASHPFPMPSGVAVDVRDGLPALAEGVA